MLIESLFDFAGDAICDVAGAAAALNSAGPIVMAALVPAAYFMNSRRVSRLPRIKSSSNSSDPESSGASDSVILLINRNKLPQQS